MRIDPVSGIAIPAQSFRSEVFPLPFAPMTDVTPALMDRESITSVR
jgi:hypothetical protein